MSNTLRFGELLRLGLPFPPSLDARGSGEKVLAKEEWANPKIDGEI